MNKSTENYLADIYGRKSVKEIGVDTMTLIMENIDVMGPDATEDIELRDAYLTLHGLKALNLDQWNARKHKLEK